jgi:threonine/homoserine/homoserine lactone efflux protein
MIEPTLLYLYITALIAIYLSPGPDMALVLAVSASQGRRAGLSIATGIAFARALHVLGSGLGLAVLFSTHPSFQNIVRVAGAGYLLFWAWKIIRTPLKETGVPIAGSSVGSDMMRGFLTNLLNPKALLFCSLLLPQFTSPERGTLLLQFVLLGGVLVSIGLLFDISYVFVANGVMQRLGSKMSNGIRFRLRLEKVRNSLMIIVLGGVAIRLLIG